VGQGVVVGETILWIVIVVFVIALVVGVLASRKRDREKKAARSKRFKKGYSQEKRDRKRHDNKRC
jgi:uncharacterized membrane protein